MTLLSDYAEWSLLLPWFLPPGGVIRLMRVPSRSGTGLLLYVNPKEEHFQLFPSKGFHFLYQLVLFARNKHGYRYRNTEQIRSHQFEGFEAQEYFYLFGFYFG